MTVPVIESILFFPVEGGTSPSVLAPGGRLAIKGKHFGTAPGKIVIHGQSMHFEAKFKYGDVELTQLKWLDNERINGVIPSGMIKPLDKVGVEIRVHRADGKVSQPRMASFQVVSETRWLTMSNVTVEQCGKDSNNWVCNKVKHSKPECGFIVLTAPSFDYSPKPNAGDRGLPQELRRRGGATTRASTSTRYRSRVAGSSTTWRVGARHRRRASAPAEPIGRPASRGTSLPTTTSTTG